MDQEAITSGVKVVSSIFDQVRSAPSHVLLILVLNVIGIFLKALPQIPNRSIPLLLILGGTTLYPLIASPASIDPSFRYPFLILSLYGFLLGAGAIAVHAFLKQFEKFRKMEARLATAFAVEEVLAEAEKQIEKKEQDEKQNS